MTDRSALRPRWRVVWVGVILVVVAVIAVGAFASRVGEEAEPIRTAGDAPPSTTVQPRALPAPLSSAGVAVQTEAGVQLLGLDGTALAALDGHRLEGWLPSSSPVQLVDRDGSHWTIDLAANALVPTEEPPVGRVPEVPFLAPPPTTPDVTMVVGHWMWALPSPDGASTLVQWSGECEVPYALLLGSDDQIRSVFGGAWVDSPWSFGLGWSPDGRAVVFAEAEPGCGSGLPKDGVYLVDLDGSSTLLAEGSAAQMWTQTPQAASSTTTTVRPPPRSSLADSPVGFDRVGPVALGMNRFEVERRLGYELRELVIGNGVDCAIWTPADGEGVSMRAVGGLVASIDVDAPAVTVDGLTTDATDAEIAAIYGDRVETRINRFAIREDIVTPVEPELSDLRLMIVYDTDGTLIARLRIGRVPDALVQDEGCT